MLNHLKFYLSFGVFTLLQLFCLWPSLAQNINSFKIINTRSAPSSQTDNKHTKNNNDAYSHTYIDPQSAYNQRTFIVNINWQQISEWESLDQLKNAFNIVHNQRQYNDT